MLTFPGDLHRLWGESLLLRETDEDQETHGGPMREGVGLGAELPERSCKSYRPESGDLSWHPSPATSGLVGLGQVFKCSEPQFPHL